ncbi:MAG: TRAP transporter large permease subunit [Puniceicoccales bacterium]|jgi:predicted histidine transporter YuiF (NhaC family)|nr:TRAP transporter large permease subunit [Puniceicoccales bacterium]
MILTNSVFIAVLMVTILSISRVNVVIALVAGALVGGLASGMHLREALAVFSAGLGGGAEIALNYALLGAFAAAMAHSGVPIWLSHKLVKFITQRSQDGSRRRLLCVAIVLLLILAGVMSQNALPVHIAFLPILIPPLLGAFAVLKMDRRLLSNAITFAMVTTYSTIPYGFGSIFLENVVLKNLVENGLTHITLRDVLWGSIFPALGMVVGLITSCYAYRKPRTYDLQKIQSIEVKEKNCSTKNIIISIIAITCMLVAHICWDNMMGGAMVGLLILNVGQVISWRDSDTVVMHGFRMMAAVAFVMIAAAGFAAVLRETGDVHGLVAWLTNSVGSNKGIAALGMITVGLIITMGIGSSFSTVPIVASIYVPFCQALGFSIPATICITIAAAVTGDAGSPASDTMLGMTSGFNMDGQHDHIWDTTIPAFIHFNIPQVIFGVIGAMVL